MALTAGELAELSDASGLNLAAFRPAHVEARVARELQRSGADSLEQLAARVATDAPLRAAFRRSIAISVTGLFRDPEQFTLLAEELPALSGIPRLRVWSAGCSDGRELWTVALLLDRAGLLAGSELLGSDLLEENVGLAELGPAADDLGEMALPPATPRFETRDIVRDGAPAGAWNLVLCRNLAIYLAPGARARLHALLCEAVAPAGLLLLGRSERLADPRGMGMERVGPHLYRRSVA